MEKFLIELMNKDEVEDVFEIEKTFFGLQKIDSIVSTLDSKTLNYFVIKVYDKIVGFLESSVVLDEAELFEIAIVKSCQGKGFAKELLKYFFNYCKEKNVRTIFLEVNNSNIKALSLYKSFGFVQYSIRKKYYGDNDAILMKYDF